MKRIVLAALLVLGLGAVAWADSIVVGFGAEPVLYAPLSASIGYAGPNWVVLGQKAALNSFYGVWSICALWNPVAGQIGDTSVVTRWRVGGTIGIDWEPTYISYGGASIIAGAEIDWSILTGYIQFAIGGSQLIMPQIGIELRIPLGNASPTG